MTTEPEDLPQLRERVRVLIESGALPSKPPQKMFAGRTIDRHKCKVCSETLSDGAVEYEVSAADHVVYLHPRCFYVWRQFDQQTAEFSSTQGPNRFRTA